MKREPPQWRTEPLTSPEDRKGPQGRKRSGPKGVAVRELARVTIRARGVVLALWDAAREAERLPPHEFLELLLTNHVNRMDPERQDAVLRATKRRKREHYKGVP